MPTLQSHKGDRVTTVDNFEVIVRLDLKAELRKLRLGGKSGLTRLCTHLPSTIGVVWDSRYERPDYSTETIRFMKPSATSPLLINRS